MDFIALLAVVSMTSNSAPAEVLTPSEVALNDQAISLEQARLYDQAAIARENVRQSFEARFASSELAAQILGADVALKPSIKYVDYRPLLNPPQVWISGELSKSEIKTIRDCELSGKQPVRKQFSAEIDVKNETILFKEVGYFHNSGCE